MLNSIQWKLKRLRAMSGAEVLYRVRQAAQSRAEKLGWSRAKPPLPVSKASSAWCLQFPVDFDRQRYLDAADHILSGHFDIFAMRGAKLGFPPQWNQDPKTGVVVPLVFGKTLNYRDEQLVGDIKYLWEPNRHLQLVTLAQAWHLSGDVRYAKGCQTLLDSWFSQCPYPLGVNWVSSLEHSVRLLNWSLAWHLLGGDSSVIFQGAAGSAFKDRWLRSVYEHCHFIAGHFSRFSSANNHLLGEYMGLLVGALTWPCWPESSHWLKTGSTGFEAEALQQTGEDGVNKEQAFYYHHEVADMMLMCALIGRANGVTFGTAFWERLEDMLVFIAATMDSSGNVPMVGDADDALMAHLSQENGWSHYQSLLATGAVLFERSDLANKAIFFDEKSRWLLGDQAGQKFVALQDTTVEEPRTAFNDSGYYILGARYGAPDEVRALIDCGNLGYLSIAAHGHADALAMVLSAGGREILVDPGTYAYHTQKKWRDYFRSTYAHNTVTIDGSNQSEIGGNFLWLSKANAHCLDFKAVGEMQSFEGWHDGYMRLQDPLKHQRAVSFDVNANEFNVTDTLICGGDHQVEICWHLAESCQVRLEGAKAFVLSGSVQLVVEMIGQTLALDLRSATENPPCGWISRTFDEKVPTNTLVWHGAIRGDTVLQTKLSLTFSH